MKQKIRLLLLVLFGSVFLFSGWKLLGILRTYQEGTQTYNDLSQYVSFEPVTQPTTPSADAVSPTVPATTQGPDLSDFPQVDFDELFQINPDVIGWIYIDGTNISYPVVQGSDNDYYLDHLFDGTQNRSGCIFLDYRCSADLTDRHSIIYGHHLKDRSMFTNLMRYKKQSFYDEHPVVLLVTPDAYIRVRLFSGYVSNNRSNAWDLEMSRQEFEAWLEEVQEKSRFRPQSTPTAEDSILTLSTCTYEFDNAKFVLHGYIEEIIENPS